MKQRTKALLAAVISGAAFAGLVGGLIFWLPSYKEKKEMEAIKPQETQNAAPPTDEPEATPDPAGTLTCQFCKPPITTFTYITTWTAPMISAACPLRIMSAT